MIIVFNSYFLLKNNFLSRVIIYMNTFNLNYPATDSVILNKDIVFNIQEPEKENIINDKIFGYNNAYFDNSNNYPPVNTTSIKECFTSKKEKNNETNLINLYLTLIVLLLVVFILFIATDKI